MSAYQSLDDLDPFDDAPEIVAPPDPTLSDLRTNPVSSDPRAPMTRREASFHASIADARAVQAHRNGEGEAAALAEQGATALIEHAARPDGAVITFGKVGFRRPNAYSVYAVAGMDKLFAEAADLYPLDHTGLLLFAFHDPKHAHGLACIEKDAAHLIAQARDLILALEYPEHIDAAKEWCQEQFAALNGVKKPSAAAPASSSPAAAKSPGPSSSPASPAPAPPAATTPGHGSASSPTP